METQIKQAMITLQVYLKRGKAALVKLDEGEIDDAMSLCLWRGAAYHNFLSLDSSLAQKGCDIAHDQDFKAIWQEIRATNRLLAVKLHEAMEMTKNEIITTRQRKSTISKFHSGALAQNYVKRI